MGSIPFAFSVHNFIKSVGADAGFASIIGLAILVLLYFAQARETASLREQAYEAAQRVAQLEGRIAQLTRELAARVVPGAPAVAKAPVARPLANSVPAATAGAAANASSAVRVPVVAGAPAGVGAPALTAATKLIPTPALGVPQPVAGASSSPQPVAGAASSPQPQPIDLTAMVPPPPPPATVAGGANGSGQEHLAAQPFAAPPPPAPAPAGAAPPPPRAQIRPGAASRAGRRPMPPPPRSRPGRGGTSVGRRIAAGLAVLVAIGVVVGGLLLLTSSNGSKQAATSTAGASNAPTKQHHRTTPPAAPAFKPSSVTVSVLNGTATSGLAGRVAAKLTAGGYKQGTVATAADQTRTATVVAYLPGHRNDALHVASSLKVPVANVQAVDSSAQAVACPSGTTCAPVIVTVGSDLANTQ